MERAAVESRISEAVSDTFNALTAEFGAMFESVYATNTALDEILPDDCSITTMSVLGLLTMGGEGIRTTPERVRSAILAHGDERLQLAVPKPPKPPRKVTAKNKDKIKKKKGPSDGTFHNATIVTFDTISIKIFLNGKIQAAGCRTIVHFIIALDAICAALGNGVRMESLRVTLVNASFGTHKTVPLEVFCDQLRGTTHNGRLVNATYESDIYAGLKCSMPRRDHAGTLSVTVFKSGSVLISATCAADIADAYGFICRAIDACPVSEEVVVPVKRKVPSELVLYDGYDKQVYLLCGSTWG